MLWEQKDLLLINPRRVGFNKDDKSMEKHQIDWEYRHINYSNLLLFWFPCETLCPITLFELGKIVGSNRRFVIGAHPDYKRRTDLIEQLSHTHPGLTIHSTVEATVDDLKSRLTLGT